MKNNTPRHPLIGIGMILFGGWFVAIGLKLVHVQDVHVPLWVMSFVGIFVAICGIAVVIGQKHPQEPRKYMHSLVWMLCSMIGFGLGFLDEANTAEKWILGLSSTICLLVSVFILTCTSKQK